MKRLGVQYRPEAQANLESIFIYVLERSGDWQVATRYVDRIYARCERLGETPLSGTARDDLRKGIRLTGFERRAAIAFTSDGDGVEIIRILHGGRDVENLRDAGQ
ncbi:type II toxin-antitoxin system RelE/ParE family toxin [Minwuia sp.]|uniref:type II toxin-antitoxin system RelE/ParE family toxin n=1 Tax=Minwuia sp. TaxID=2493630 RepID=UPI003A8D3199